MFLAELVKPYSQPNGICAYLSIYNTIIFECYI